MGLYDRDYMRTEPPGEWSGNHALLAVVAFIGIVVFWGYSTRRNTTEMQMQPFQEALKNAHEQPNGVVKRYIPKLLETKSVDVGQFEVFTGELAVSDPGFDLSYTRPGSISLRLSYVRKGQWRARAIMHKDERQSN